MLNEERLESRRSRVEDGMIEASTTFRRVSSRLPEEEAAAIV